MAGSAGVAALISLWTFWILLAIGAARGDIGFRNGALFILLWALAFIGTGLAGSPLLFPPIVALLDVALVFAVFKGDVRITG